MRFSRFVDRGRADVSVIDKGVIEGRRGLTLDRGDRNFIIRNLSEAFTKNIRVSPAAKTVESLIIWMCEQVVSKFKILLYVNRTFSIFSSFELKFLNLRPLFPRNHFSSSFPTTIQRFSKLICIACEIVCTVVKVTRKKKKRLDVEKNFSREFKNLLYAS